MLLLCVIVLVCSINSVFSGITSTPGMQRYSFWETATFQWSVTGTISNYSVYDLSGTLTTKANYILDTLSGVVILTITNVEPSDAGNYTLAVTIGNRTQTDSGALLFVYGEPTMFVNQTFDISRPLPSTEGDPVELTCTFISTSLPAEYRPKIIYYMWYLTEIGFLQNISSGPAKHLNSDYSVPGYSIKDDGRTLVIESAQYSDTQGISCYGQEQWSPRQFDAFSFLTLNYRPRINFFYYETPSSKKFNAVVNDQISISFNYDAMPPITSATNWTFINSAGYSQDLPVGSSSINSYSSSLEFILTSESYYGNYSITFTNIVGSTTTTFEVFRPGPPDAPSNVRADFISHYLIVIAWDCMWFNGRQQTTFLQLRTLYDNSFVNSQNKTLNYYPDCFNTTFYTVFQTGIYPETDYVVRVWSTNNISSSEVITLNVTTPKVFKFFVSSKNVSLNGNQAIVNFSATESKIAKLDVTYCLELTGFCSISYYYNQNSTCGQITVNNLPPGDVYLFSFVVNGGNPSANIYSLTTVQGVRVTRNGEADKDPVFENSNSYLTPVIVLAVLLGVAVLALIGCIIALIVFKLRQDKQPNDAHGTQQPKTTANTARSPKATTQRRNEAFEEDNTYESVEGDSAKNDSHYTALER